MALIDALKESWDFFVAPGGLIVLSNPSILLVSNPVITITIIYWSNCIIFRDYLISDKHKAV